MEGFCAGHTLKEWSTAGLLRHLARRFLFSDAPACIENLKTLSARFWGKKLTAVTKRNKRNVTSKVQKLVNTADSVLASPAADYIIQLNLLAVSVWCSTFSLTWI